MDMVILWESHPLPQSGNATSCAKWPCTIIGCNQWLSLDKIALKVSHVGRNRSLVARTNRCGECDELLHLQQYLRICGLHGRSYNLGTGRFSFSLSLSMSISMTRPQSCSETFGYGGFGEFASHSNGAPITCTAAFILSRA
jgi:hypothetical protein